jgi:diguanylate cyclase (GGDEF)-like protein
MRTPIDATSVYVEVVRSGRPLFLADPAADPLFAGDLLAASGARSVLVHPVQSGDATLGVLVVAWDERIDSVSDQRAATVDLLADETALALDNEALLRRLERTAATDALTGLPNRRSWEADLPALIASARRTGAPLSIAVADLDHFKVYNDTFGHQAGDDLLRRFAAVCTEVLREPDVVARWGGEEFVIALPACPEAHAQRVLDRLRAAVPEGQTCSIGLAVWDGVESPDALLARADAALYRAKALGRDTVASAAVGSDSGPSMLTSSSDS